MAEKPSPVEVGTEGLRLAVKLAPRSSSDRMDGIETDAASRAWLKVRVTAKPVDGQANRALVEFLAKRWSIPKSSFAIVSGATARNKVLAIAGNGAALRAAIEADL